MSPNSPSTAPRRVVTGVRNGMNVFIDDGPAGNIHHYATIPGMAASILYQTAPTPSLPPADDAARPITEPVLPAPGETVLMIVTFPPDAVMASSDFDPHAAAAEQSAFYPQFAASFDPTAPGFHRTESVDYDIVLDGEIWLELDNETRHLAAGDVVVQGGTRHAWRNNGDRAATMCFVLIGAQPPTTT